MTPSTLDGLDLDALDRHLRSEGIARIGQLRAELIAGGRSNLTFLVFDDASKWVLRRPPLHGLTPSAHDMAREYRDNTIGRARRFSILLSDFTLFTSSVPKVC